MYVFPAGGIFVSLWTDDVKSSAEMADDVDVWLKLDRNSFQTLDFQEITDVQPIFSGFCNMIDCYFLHAYIHTSSWCIYVGKKNKKISREGDWACSHVPTFVLSQQPFLNMSLAQNHQFNLATIFSGVHGSSLCLSWQSEQLNFPEW